MVAIFDVSESLGSEPIAQVYVWTARYYLVDEEHLLCMAQSVAFCCVCRDFVPSERLTTSAQEASEYRKWRPYFENDEFTRETLGDSYVDREKSRRIDDYRQRIRMLRSRQSPPRCLTCGSTDIVQAQDAKRDEEFFRLMHPDYLPDGLVVDGNTLGLGNDCVRLFSTEGEELRFTPDETEEIVRRLKL